MKSKISLLMPLKNLLQVLLDSYLLGTEWKNQFSLLLDKLIKALSTNTQSHFNRLTITKVILCSKPHNSNSMVHYHSKPQLQV